MDIVNDKLQALTNTFLKEFFEIANVDERNNNSFHFHDTLPKMLDNNNTFLEIEDDYACLMGMSTLEDTFAKLRCNKRLQGFNLNVLDIIDLLKKNEETEHFSGLVEDTFFKNEEIFDVNIINDKVQFQLKNEDVKHNTFTFNVNNPKNNFKGTVFVDKKIQEKIVSENDIIKEMLIDKITFFNQNEEEIMTITFDFDGNEKGEFTHYKHIADINSFFYLIKNYS